MALVRVQVWSDVACPWCWVGKRRLEKALAQRPAGLEVEVAWRSFELDRGAPRAHPAGSYAARLARKYGTSLPDAEGMIARMTSVGAAEGLELRFDRARGGNTFDAHRVLHLARERGVQAEVKERLFRAYFTEGEDLGDPEGLARVAAEAGLDAAEVRALLDGGRWADAVRLDEAEAARLGIHAVPFFVLAGRFGVAGAQPTEVLAQALRTAAAAPMHAAQGDASGPDGFA